MNSSEGPYKITSKKHIEYRPSLWKVHRFQVQSGEVKCTVEVLRMRGSLLVWASAGGMDSSAGEALGELALALPRLEATGADATATSTLMSALGDGVAAALARRLTLLLQCPVYVCCNEFDRLTLHVLEKGLFSEIKKKPDFFKCNQLHRNP